MTIRRKIKRAIDGDTLELYTKIRGTNFIRLAGIDTPERGERGYFSAKNDLGRLRNKVVSLVPKGRSYNRVVADVRFKGRKINKKY